MPDIETAELMSGFYRRLVEGKGRAAALREAQLELGEEIPIPPFGEALFAPIGPEMVRAWATGSPRVLQTVRP